MYDAALEQPAEQRAVQIGLELLEPLHRLVAAREQCQHRADTLHGAEGRQPGCEPGRAALQFVVEACVP